MTLVKSGIYRRKLNKNAEENSAFFICKNKNKQTNGILKIRRIYGG
jgi:hypothetical protein